MRRWPERSYLDTTTIARLLSLSPRGTSGEREIFPARFCGPRRNQKIVARAYRPCVQRESMLPQIRSTRARRPCHYAERKVCAAVEDFISFRFCARIETMNHPSPDLRPPSPPLGEREGVRGQIHGESSRVAEPEPNRRRTFEHRTPNIEPAQCKPRCQWDRPHAQAAGGLAAATFAGS